MVLACATNTHALWTHNGGPLPNNAHSISSVSLIINDIHLHNWGIYECIGTSDEYMFQTSAFLKVYG